MPWGVVWVRTVIAIAALVLLATSANAQSPPPTSWPMAGQDIRNTRNQAVTALSPQNVGSLVPKWVFETGGDVSATPAVTNATVYFPDWAGNFYAVNALTGQERWSHKISDWTGIAGDLARNTPMVDGNTLIFGDLGGMLAKFTPQSGLTGPGARVMAVNATTGDVIWVTQIEAFPGAIITSSPVALNGVVYVGVSSREESLAEAAPYPCCIFQGSVVALDENTGQILWQTYVLPPNGGQPGGYSGAAIWGSTPAIDLRRSSLYVVTGNNYYLPDDVETCIQNAQKTRQSDAVCNGTDNYAQDYFDSILSLDLKTGKINWGLRVQGYDAQNFACGLLPPGVTWCPSPQGPDFDFGAGANLFTAMINGRPQDVVGAGQKSGIYWAVDPDTGEILWQSLVGPGGVLGGIEWGTATDGKSIYVPLSDSSQHQYRMGRTGVPANGGSWAAISASDGRIEWQTMTPGFCPSVDRTGIGGCMALGPPTLAGSVVFVSSMDVDPTHPTMFALDAASGRILWSYASGSSVVAAPAVVGTMVYWGSGYRRVGVQIGTANNKLFAFGLSTSPLNGVP
jgi:polyvinyl alcohol dehydrogenase (cytochrome)